MAHLTDSEVDKAMAELHQKVDELLMACEKLDSEQAKEISEKIISIIRVFKDISPATLPLESIAKLFFELLEICDRISRYEEFLDAESSMNVRLLNRVPH